MPRSIKIIAAYLLIASAANGQARITERISHKLVSDLWVSLNKKTDDSTRIGIYLKLAEYYLQKDGVEKADLDSADMTLKKAAELNSRPNPEVYSKPWNYDGLLLLEKAILARKSGRLEEARQISGEAIRLLRDYHDHLNLIKAYLNLSLCFDANDPQQSISIDKVYNALFQPNNNQFGGEPLNKYMLELRTHYILDMKGPCYPIRLDYLDHLVKVSQADNNKKEEFWDRKEMADIHFQQGHADQAIGELLQIAKEQREGGFPAICFTYDLLSGVYDAVNNYEKGLYYALESIKNIRAEDDSAYLPYFYARIANNYSWTGSVADAVEWNRKRLDYQIATGRTDGAYSILLNVVSDMIRMGQAKEALQLALRISESIPNVRDWERRGMLLSLAECYSAVRDTPEAKKYSEELASFNEGRIEHKQLTSDAQADQFLTSFYLSIGQYDKAEKYFKQFKAEIHSGLKNSIPTFDHNFLFTLDSARGNYISAIRHLQAYQKAKDSIFTETKTRQIEDLKIKYATDQKDSLISLNKQNIELLTTQGQLQKTELHQAAVLRNVSFAVVGLLTAIAALLYYSYRSKQKTNKRLKLQQDRIAKQNVSLQHLLDEKEWLVKEIHHRVKNNLQIVMSLLNSQSAYIDNEPALAAIHDSQHRVQAMSLIHQKLYGSENISSIDLSLYIRELTSYLADSYETGQRIRFEFSIAPLEIDVSQAVPLGLILNEAITNSVKYAFPDGRAGSIRISLLNLDAGHYLLTISDNGIGLPAKFAGKKPGSLGMSLMEGLTEDLNGHFSIENGKGTTVKIIFEYAPGNE